MEKNSCMEDIDRLFTKLGFKEYCIKDHGDILGCEFTDEDLPLVLYKHKDEIANCIKQCGFGIFSVKQCQK